jgi:L-alanine-DL-glutamate epimerase-like enolase superfamily enzyme
MKITDFEYRTISIPFIPAIQEHSGMVYPTTLVWVYTDEGLTGLGESNSLNSDITDQADQIAERYVGKIFGRLISPRSHLFSNVPFTIWQDRHWGYLRIS